MFVIMILMYMSYVHQVKMYILTPYVIALGESWYSSEITDSTDDKEASLEKERLWVLIPFGLLNV